MLPIDIALAFWAVYQPRAKRPVACRPEHGCVFVWHREFAFCVRDGSWHMCGKGLSSDGLPRATCRHSRVEDTQCVCVITDRVLFQVDDGIKDNQQDRVFNAEQTEWMEDDLTWTSDVVDADGASEGKVKHSSAHYTPMEWQEIKAKKAEAKDKRREHETQGTLGVLWRRLCPDASIEATRAMERAWEIYGQARAKWPAVYSAMKEEVFVCTFATGIMAKGLKIDGKFNLAPQPDAHDEATVVFSLTNPFSGKSYSVQGKQLQSKREALRQAISLMTRE